MTKIPFSLPFTSPHPSILSQTGLFFYTHTHIHTEAEIHVNICMLHSHDIQRLQTSRVFLSFFFSVSHSFLILIPSSTVSPFLYFPSIHPHIKFSRWKNTSNPKQKTSHWILWNMLLFPSIPYLYKLLTKNSKCENLEIQFLENLENVITFFNHNYGIKKYDGNRICQEK